MEVLMISRSPFSYRHQSISSLRFCIIVVFVLILSSITGCKDPYRFHKWHWIADPEGVFAAEAGGRVWVYDITRIPTLGTTGRPGYVAVGTRRYTSPTIVNAAAVWVSPDAVSWQRVDVASNVFQGSEPWSMKAVTTNGSDVIAVGTIGTTGPTPVKAWTTRNGLNWTIADVGSAILHPGDRIEYAVGDIAAYGNTVVVVGESDDKGIIWKGTTTGSWTVVFQDQPGSGITRVERTRDEFVAVGHVSAGGTGARAAVWTSADGSIWARGPIVEYSRPLTATALKSDGSGLLFEDDCFWERNIDHSVNTNPIMWSFTVVDAVALPMYFVVSHIDGGWGGIVGGYLRQSWEWTDRINTNEVTPQVMVRSIFPLRRLNRLDGIIAVGIFNKKDAAGNFKESGGIWIWADDPLP
jgi:hypothetical protein